MIEAAEQVHVVFDPVDRPDAMHAALFVAPNVRLHRARYFGIELLQRFTEGRIHADIVRAAMAGRLGHADFGALLRPLRWTLPARIVRMLQVMRARADADRTIRYCEIIRARKKVPQVETMYNQLTAAKGQKKPAE